MSDAFDQSETFRASPELKKTTLRNGLLLLIPLALIPSAVVSLILGDLGVPVPWLFGLAFGFGFGLALNKARGRKLDKLLSGTSLTLDSRGITQKDDIATRFVSWEGLREARKVKPVVGMSLGKVGRGARPSKTPGVDALGSVAAVKELGLVGAGTVELSAGASMMSRETYRQNEARNGLDAVTGQPLVALYLQQFHLRWPDERIGEWVDHFRPDVFAGAKAMYDEQNRAASISLRETVKEARAKAKAERAGSEEKTAEGEDSPK